MEGTQLNSESAIQTQTTLAYYTYPFPYPAQRLDSKTTIQTLNSKGVGKNSLRSRRIGRDHFKSCPATGES